MNEYEYMTEEDKRHKDQLESCPCWNCMGCTFMLYSTPAECDAYQNWFEEQTKNRRKSPYREMHKRKKTHG